MNTKQKTSIFSTMDQELTDATYNKFVEMLNKKSGIVLREYKKYLLINRLNKLIGYGKKYLTYEEYYKALVNDKSNTLMTEFLNILTTNFSYFFREPAHFPILTSYLQEVMHKEPYIRIWSAASSTGEEAYSIAITIAKNHILHPNLKILGTDISTKVLNIAMKGEYPLSRSQQYITKNDLNTYFHLIPANNKENEKIVVKDFIKQNIAFRYLNLLQAYPFKKQFDIVFLRNVMIYFGTDEKEKVISKITEYLKPNGLLIVGMAESLIGVSHNLKAVKQSVYKK